MATIGSSYPEHRGAMLRKDPELRAEYERLGPRYAVTEELIKARRRRRLTQTQLAERMGCGQSVVSRLESGDHSPKLETLYDAATAMGYRVDIRLVENRKRQWPRKARTTGPRSPDGGR
jgi:ribosome-binding protein aMBF1 (putative translation factor)